jgi:hypothetical protein
LFALADEINLSWSAKKNVDNILHEDGAALFLDATLDSMYWMAATNNVSEDSIEVSFDSNSFTLPAQYVSTISSITMTVNGQTVTDWTVKKVDRNKSNDICEFVVTYTSEVAKDITFEDGDLVVIEIRAYDSDEAKSVSFTFAVEKTYVLKVAVSTKFTRL